MVFKSSPATAIISAVSPANSLSNDIFTLSPCLQPEPQAAIPEENEDISLSVPVPAIVTSPEEIENDDFISAMTPMRPTLRRHASHESLISVSGMDIHTLQSRPSQLLYSSSPRFSTPGNASSVGPELTPWTATAHGTLSRKNLDSSMLNRSLLNSAVANKRGPRKSDGPIVATPSTGTGIGRKVGGWVFGKWGATPAPSSPSTSSSPRPASSKSQDTQSSHSTATAPATATSTPTPTPSTLTAPAEPAKKKTEKEKPKLRPSGVNQSGPIWGFFDIPETPENVLVSEYDADALVEALAEELTQ
jgi:hypothetical protein